MMSVSILMSAFGLQDVDLENLYKSLISNIRNQQLEDKIVSNALILELSEQVEKQGGSRAGVPPNKLSVRQFCHVLAFLADREKFPQEEKVSISLKKVLYNPRDLASLRSKVESEELLPEQRWDRLRRFIPAREPAQGDGGTGGQGGGQAVVDCVLAPPGGARESQELGVKAECSDTQASSR